MKKNGIIKENLCLALLGQLHAIWPTRWSNPRGPKLYHARSTPSVSRDPHVIPRRARCRVGPTWRSLARARAQWFAGPRQQTPLSLLRGTHMSDPSPTNSLAFLARPARRRLLGWNPGTL
jgi:hypothetical protein